MAATKHTKTTTHVYTYIVIRMTLYAVPYLMWAVDIICIWAEILHLWPLYTNDCEDNQSLYNLVNYIGSFKTMRLKELKIHALYTIHNCGKHKLSQFICLYILSMHVRTLLSEAIEMLLQACPHMQLCNVQVYIAECSHKWSEQLQQYQLQSQ